MKKFGSKYILWFVDSFIKFIQGKYINNKKAETIIDSINVIWNLNVGYPSIGYFVDNVKMNELMSKLGLTVNFGPIYSYESYKFHL